MSDETFLPLKALRPDEQNQSFCVFHSEIATFTDVDPKLFKHKDIFGTFVYDEKLVSFFFLCFFCHFVLDLL